MTGLAARLILGGGKHALLAHAITIAAVAVGTTLLLAALSVEPAMQARADRTAWDHVNEQADGSSDRPYTAMLSVAQFHPTGKIDTVWLAPSEAESPVFPGLERNPREGEVFASPAVAKLIEDDGPLAERYGEDVDLIGDEALSSPDHRLVVRHLPDHVDTASVMVERVLRFNTHGDIDGPRPEILRMLIAVGAVGLLAPVVMLITSAIKLTATARERRLATLRLVGATRRQVLTVTTLESAVVGALGALGGVVLFVLARPLLAIVDLDGERWFVSDIRPSASAATLLVIGVLLATTLVGAYSTHAAAFSPFASAKRATPARLGRWRIVALAVLGTGNIAVISLDLGGRVFLLAGATSIVVAFLIFGPWLTRMLAKAMAVGGRGARLLAARRLDDDPRSGFRATAGVAVAVFAATMFTVATPAAVAAAEPDKYSALRAGAAQTDLNVVTAAATTDLISELGRIRGVTAEAIHEGVAYTTDRDRTIRVWFGVCEKIIRVVAVDPSACGHADVVVSTNLKNTSRTKLDVTQLGAEQDGDASSEISVPLTDISYMDVSDAYDAPGVIVTPQLNAAAIDDVAPNHVILRYESLEALERARTLIQDADPTAQLISGAEATAGNTEGARITRAILVAATLTTYGVAALAMLATASAALLERRMPYALLRASGVPLGVLRRAMLLEAGAPLAAGALLSAGFGVVAASAITQSVGPIPALAWAVTWPVLVGLVGAVGVAAAASTSIGRVTSIDQVRFE